jgi:hypothetical protein
VITTRPKVAELIFRLYGRSLHPELFQICKTRVVEREAYRAKIDITPAGHLVTWQSDEATLCEVVTAAHYELPRFRCLHAASLHEAEEHVEQSRNGVQYGAKFGLEIYSPKHFWKMQKQAAHANVEDGLLHRFDSNGRVALGALSYVFVKSNYRRLVVRSFHTFPEDYTVVCCESLFRTRQETDS